MENHNNVAIRISVHEQLQAGVFPVIVTYESGVEDLRTIRVHDDLLPIMQQQGIEAEKVLYRAHSYKEIPR